MDTRARIAWNLRNLRSLRHITQENLAVDAQVDRTVISDLGERKTQRLYRPIGSVSGRIVCRYLGVLFGASDQRRTEANEGRTEAEAELKGEILGG